MHFHLKDRVDEGFRHAARRFEQVDHRFDKLDARFDSLQQTLIQIGAGIIVALMGVIATQL